MKSAVRRMLTNQDMNVLDKLKGFAAHNRVMIDHSERVVGSLTGSCKVHHHLVISSRVEMEEELHTLIDSYEMEESVPCSE